MSKAVEAWKPAILDADVEVIVMAVRGQRATIRYRLSGFEATVDLARLKPADDEPADVDAPREDR
jgi:hypothetical protein